MNKLALAITINFGLFALYSVIIFIITKGEFNQGMELFFVSIMHAAIAFISGFIIIVVQSMRQKEVLFGIGCLIAAPLIFIVGFASCFVNSPNLMI